MKDAFAAMAAFTGICLIVVLGLHLLSRWHQRIDRRLRGYPTIARADLEAEAAATEAGYIDLPAHIRHRNEGPPL